MMKNETRYGVILSGFSFLDLYSVRRAIILRNRCSKGAMAVSIMRVYSLYNKVWISC